MNSIRPTGVSGAPARSSSKARIIAAGLAGTILEWFDFSVYAAVAIYLAPLFFPSENETLSLLSALAVLAVGFLARPLGALFFGRLGDRRGRRDALALSIVLMGVSTLVLGLAPTYTSIGIVGTLVFILARLGQGFSAGGEFGGGAVYLTEWARAGKKGLYGAIFYTGTVAGPVAGSATVAVLSATLSPEDMSTWGWRIPFFIGALAAVVGLLLRSRLADTPEFESAQREGDVSAAPIKESFTKSWLPMLRCVGLVVGFTISTHAYLNMQSFIVSTTGLSARDTSVIFTITYAIQVPLIILSGWLSDRVGRKILLAIGSVGLLISVWPMFLLVNQGTVASVFLGLLLVSFFLAVYAGPFTASLAELMPRRTRFSSLSIAYAFTAATFGGTAGYVVAWLKESVGDFAPALYATIAAAVTFTTVALMRRSWNVEHEEERESAREGSGVA